MVKKLRCDVVTSDWVRVVKYGEDIAVQVNVGGENTDIFLTHENAKKLRKQIKVALAEIEGEDGQDDQEKEEPAYIPHVGEVVEVYRNTCGHAFNIGEKVRFFITAAGNWGGKKLDGSDWWAVGGDIRPIQNWKPKEGEKVLIVGSTYLPCEGSESFVGKFGTVKRIPGSISVYNEDKSDWFNFNLSDLRPAE